MRTREEIYEEVMSEAIAYVDGDPENGPRYNHGITKQTIEEEVDRRLKEEAEL